MSKLQSDIAAFLEAEAKASKAPWEFERVGFDDGSFAYEHNLNGVLIAFREINYENPTKAKFDSEFVQSARNLAPSIIRRLESQNRVMRKRLEHISSQAQASIISTEEECDMSANWVNRRAVEALAEADKIEDET